MQPPAEIPQAVERALLAHCGVHCAALLSRSTDSWLRRFAAHDCSVRCLNADIHALCKGSVDAWQEALRRARHICLAHMAGGIPTHYRAQ